MISAIALVDQLYESGEQCLTSMGTSQWLVTMTLWQGQISRTSTLLMEHAHSLQIILLCCGGVGQDAGMV